MKICCQYKNEVLLCQVVWLRAVSLFYFVEDLLQVLPLLTEKQYVSAVHSRLMDSQTWKLPGLQATCRLAWALSLRVLSQLPQGCGK